MSVHLVETSEEDSYLAVARYIGELLNTGSEVRTALADTAGSRLGTDCEALLAQDRFVELLEKLLPHVEILYSKASRTDLECCQNILCHLVARCPPQQAQAAAKQVAAAFTADVDKYAEQRLQALTELYNVLEDPATQHYLLLQAIAYAKKANLATLLAPVVRNRVEDWIKEWKLNHSQARDLYLACADLLRSSSKKRKTAAKDAYRLTLKCLGTYDGSSGQDLAAVKDVAAAAVVEFIRSPDQFQFDLLESPAVAQLKGDAKHGKVYDLLTVVLNGDLKAYQSFDKAALQALELDDEELLAKIRLTALMALGSNNSHALRFGDIQAALGLQDNSEVEGWIVRAIGKKLIEGRINQVEGTFAVTKCAQRTFGKGQWTELREQLGAWKDSVRRVQDLVQTQRQNLGQGMIPTTPARYSAAGAVYA
jgi:translation initiation factor 3 subunit M